MRFKISLFKLYICLIGLNLVGIFICRLFNFELFRQVIGSIYLMVFVGPVLVCFLFEDVLYKGGFLDYMLHSVGISILVLLFSGILLSLLVKLNAFTLLLFINCLVIFIIFICRNYISNINLFLDTNSSLFVGLIIFFLSLVSTYMCTFYLVNWLVILVLLINLVIILVIRNLNKNKYPIYIFFLSLSLLIINSTISCFFRATDNIVEFYFSKLIIEKGHWLYYLHNDINSMPGPILIPTIYSEYCGYSLTTFFRLTLPILASLIPVILYTSYLKLFDHKVSIYSVLFFISTYVYYTWFGLTAKQVFSGIFLALLILLISSDYNNVSKATLAILYGVGVIVCHYGTAYVYILCVIGVYLVNLITKKINYNLFSRSYILFYCVAAFAWYIYVASSAPFDTMVAMLYHYIKFIIFGKFVTSNSYGGQILFSKFPIYLIVIKYLYLISILIILVGLIYDVLNRKIHKFSMLSMIAIIFIFLSFTGNLSSTMTPDRIFQIISFFISPFFVFGFLYISKLTKLDAYYLISFFLVIFLLFNTCFVAEVTWRYNVGPTLSISYPRIVKDGSVMEIEYLSRVYLFLMDVYGVEWIHTFCNSFDKIFCGINSKKDFTYCGFTSTDFYIGSRNIFVIRSLPPRGSYLYLSYFNTKTSKIKVTGGLHPKLIAVSSLKLCNFDKLYSNSYCSVFLYR